MPRAVGAAAAFVLRVAPTGLAAQPIPQDPCDYDLTGAVSVGDKVISIERVDVRRDGRGCRKIWHSDEIAPSVVPKLSLETGLVYTYTKPPRQDETDAWYFTALDFCSGRTVYRGLAGRGLEYNNNFAPVTLGPDGSAYVGALGGLIRLHDATLPSGPPASAGVKARVRLADGRRVTLRRRFRACAEGR